MVVRLVLRYDMVLEMYVRHRLVVLGQYAGKRKQNGLEGAEYESMVLSLREYSPMFMTYRHNMSSSCAVSISTLPLSSHVFQYKGCAPGWANALWANVLQAGQMEIASLVVGALILKSQMYTNACAGRIDLMDNTEKMESL
jgi:hypothetical protein